MSIAGASGNPGAGSRRLLPAGSSVREGCADSLAQAVLRCATLHFAQPARLLPPKPPQNGTGSGFLFAAIINAVYCEAAGLGSEQGIASPAGLPASEQHIVRMVEEEAKAFSGERPAGLFLVLDDAESIQRGKFRKELQMLCDVLQRQGWPTGLCSPAELRWDGQQLLFKRQAVSFIVNRSTDFFWQSKDFFALRTAYQAGNVYVAPNPFTYATRSDKRLLEWLSRPDWDEELGIESGERQILSGHVPETYLIRKENVETLAQRKQEFVFKPLHGFAGRGLLDSAAVGRARLRRLVAHSDGYVAQKWVPKPSMEVQGATLWTDLRVWAYWGEIFHLSGRASRRPDRLDLTPPGGWLQPMRLFALNKCSKRWDDWCNVVTSPP